MFRYGFFFFFFFFFFLCYGLLMLTSEVWISFVIYLYHRPANFKHYRIIRTIGQQNFKIFDKRTPTIFDKASILGDFLKVQELFDTKTVNWNTFIFQISKTYSSLIRATGLKVVANMADPNSLMEKFSLDPFIPSSCFLAHFSSFFSFSASPFLSCYCFLIQLPSEPQPARAYSRSDTRMRIRM